MIMMPEYTDLNTWAASLIIDFPNDNIPQLLSNDDWRNWGNTVVMEDSFMKNFAPGTDIYSDWKSWAKDVFYTMSNN